MFSSILKITKFVLPFERNYIMFLQVSLSFTFFSFHVFFKIFQRNWQKMKLTRKITGKISNVIEHFHQSKLKLLTFLFGFQKSFSTRNSTNINFASVNYIMGIYFADFWDRLIFARLFLSSVEFSKQRQKSNSIRSLKTKYSVQ